MKLREVLTVVPAIVPGTVLLIILAGCGGLSREKAEGLISERIIIPYQLTLSVDIGDLVNESGSTSSMPLSCRFTNFPELQYAKYKGLLTVENKGRTTTVSLTELGKRSAKLLAPDEDGRACGAKKAEFDLGTRDRVEVTGIMREESRAKVEFRYRAKLSELGTDFLTNSTFRRDLSPMDQKLVDDVWPIYRSYTGEEPWRKSEAIFQKYDDGWRVVKMDYPPN